MPFVDALKLLIHPPSGWDEISTRHYSVVACLLGHTALFALVPAICGYYGTTEVGWRIGGGELVHLTSASAAQIAVSYFVAMVAGVFSVAWMIHWAGRTYGTIKSFPQCLTLASFTATPLFLVGIMHLNPTLWINLVVGLPALAYTTYIFYTGVPTMMELSQDRAFLFASAVLAFGLVALVAILAATVLLWGAGFAPAFTAG